MSEILSGFGNMTGEEARIQIESDLTSPLQGLGERRINAEARHMLQLVEQLGKVLSLEPAVKDAVIDRALHITTTTINLLLLLGSANLATNNDTKN